MPQRRKMTMDAGVDASQPSSGSVVVKQIVIWVYDPCLNGEGPIWPWPGCALCRHREHLPIDPNLYHVIGEGTEEL